MRIYDEISIDDWIIRDGVVTTQGLKENVTALQKIARLDGKIRWFYEAYKDLVEDYETLIETTDTLREDVNNNTDDIATNTAQIATNTSNINTQAGQISNINSSLTSLTMTVGQHTGSITLINASLTAATNRITALENAPSKATSVYTMTHQSGSNNYTITNGTLADIASDIGSGYCVYLSASGVMFNVVRAELVATEYHIMAYTVTSFNPFTIEYFDTYGGDETTSLTSSTRMIGS